MYTDLGRPGDNLRLRATEQSSFELYVINFFLSTFPAYWGKLLSVNDMRNVDPTTTLLY